MVRFRAPTVAAATRKCAVTVASAAASPAPIRPPATAPMLHTACEPIDDRPARRASTPTATTFIATSCTPSASPASTCAATNQPIVGRYRAQCEERGDRESTSTVVRPGAERARRTGRGARPDDAAERERDERDAEPADGGAELVGQLGGRREPHRRRDTVDEEGGADAPNRRRVLAGSRRVRPEFTRRT